MSVKTKNFVAGTGYYEILEVSSVATTNEIQRSFERLCEEYVDIKNEDPQVRKSSAETLYTLTKAYETLTDPFQRMNYDDRKYGSKQNNNNEVETIFREGMKASKVSNNDTAIRFFKETVELFPHRPIYRVNLAIAYFEANNTEDAVKELRMALMLDPTNEFAQEVVAKLLFNVSDKKGIGFFINKANRQLVMVIAGMVVLVGTLYFGIPQLKSIYDKFMGPGIKLSAKEKALAQKNKMPEDLRQAIDKSSQAQNSGSSTSVNTFATIVRLDDNFKPEGRVYDYSEQEAIKKTYYKDQDMVIVDYKNGSILTYKPQDVIGWKKDTAKGTPVIISKGNEIIPVQTNIPVTLSGGKTIKPGDPGFPSRVFPEYEGPMTSPTESIAPNSVQSVVPVGNNSISSEIPSNQPSDLASLPPPPISEENKSIAAPPPPVGLNLSNNGDK